MVLNNLKTEKEEKGGETCYIWVLSLIYGLRHMLYVEQCMYMYSSMGIILSPLGT